jgi:hypothetical protein
LDQKINRGKGGLVKLRVSALDRNGVVVESALDDVNADVLNEPVLVVGGEDVNVGVTIAVSLLIGGEDVVLA